MLQTATHLAASLLMPCLESIRTRASTYTRVRATRSMHLCCPPRMQSATMNSSSNGRGIFHENAPSYPLLLRAPFSLSSASPLIAPLFFSTPPFVFYSLLPSLAFQPLRNVSLLNVPQNHSRIFPFFSHTTCFVSRNSCIVLGFIKTTRLSNVIQLATSNYSYLRFESFMFNK